jgi:hypothetical protein
MTTSSQGYYREVQNLNTLKITTVFEKLKRHELTILRFRGRWK